MTLPNCASHREARAGWLCSGCGAGLCPACTARRPVGTGTIDVCTRCGGLANVLREKRSVLHPYAASLPSAVGFPLTRAGFTAVATAALLRWLFGLLGAAWLVDGALYAYYFQIVRHTALGLDDFPGPADFRGFFEDVISPARRVATATLWMWGPGLIWLLLAGHSYLGILRGEVSAHEQHVLLALAALGTFTVPIIAIAAALDTETAQLINPVFIFGYPLKLGTDYLLCWGFFCLCLLAAPGLGELVTGLFAAAHLPLAAPFAQAGVLLVHFISWRGMGLLVRARGDEMRYGAASDYLVPVLGDALPEAHLQPGEEQLAAEAYGAAEHWTKASSEAPRTLFDPAALPTGSTAPPADLRAGSSGLQLDQGGRVFEHGMAAPLREEALATLPREEGKPIELAPEPQLGAPQELAQLWAKRDAAAAIALLRKAGRGIPALTLSAQGWLELGQACLAAQAPQLALLSLRRAAEVAPQGPLAPRAWLLAARVYDEQLGDRAMSDRVLGELRKRFPASPEGEFAGKRLGTVAK